MKTAIAIIIAALAIAYEANNIVVQQVTQTTQRPYYHTAIGNWTWVRNNWNEGALYETQGVPTPTARPGERWVPLLAGAPDKGLVFLYGGASNTGARKIISQLILPIIDL